MKKSIKIWLLIAGLLVIIGGIIFTVVMQINGWDFRKLSTVKYETNTYEFEQDFENIVINIREADIVFLPSEDGKCRVVCQEEEKLKHEVSVESDTLVIDMKDSRKWYDYINITLGETKITVYLPMDKLGSLHINSSTGDISIPKEFAFESIDISATTADVDCRASAIGKIKIGVTTGDIFIGSISAGEMELSVLTGDIRLKSVACAGDISMSASTGDMELSDITCKALFSRNRTGDIIMSNVVASSNFNIEVNTGDVIFTSCDATELFVKTSTGNIDGSLMSEKIFIAKANTGKVDVPGTTTGGRCELTTNTGNIKITIQ